jgi:hypothetical protein
MATFKYYLHVDDGRKVLRVSVEEEDGRGARSVLVTQLFNMKAAQPLLITTPASYLHELEWQSKKNNYFLKVFLIDQ